MKNPEEEWFEVKDPREYSYSCQYGFSENSPEEEERCGILRYAYGIAGATLLYFLMLAVLPNLVMNGFLWIFGAFLHNQLGIEMAYQLSLLVVAVISLVIPMKFYRMYIGLPRKVAFPFRPVVGSELLSMVLIGLGVTVISYFAMMIFTFALSVLGMQEIAPAISFPQTSLGFLLFLVNLTVVPAILEELVFRGAVMQSLRRYGDGFALVCSAVVFALVHGSLGQMPNAFVMGLVLGYFAMYTGSLMASMVLHFINNLVVVLLSFVSGKLSSEVGNILVLAVYGVFLIAGAISVIWMLKRDDKLFSLRPSLGCLSTPEKVRLLFGSAPMMLTLMVTLVVAIGNR